MTSSKSYPRARPEIAGLLVPCRYLWGPRLLAPLYLDFASSPDSYRLFWTLPGFAGRSKITAPSMRLEPRPLTRNQLS